MYEMAKTPRVPVPNPDYIPYESGIMAFIEELNSGNMDETAPSLKVTEPKEVPLEAAPTLALSAKSFAPTATGYRAPGQLENEIRDVCNRYMMGEFEDGTACTPKFIQQTISSEPEPSVGAIGQAFKTWERIGFAVIDKSPMRFVRFTADGMRFGLDEMKRRAKGQRRSARRSA